MNGQEVVRRSQLMSRDAPEGLRVAFSTIVDVGRPDGTIARFPASYRLWYSSDDALVELIRQAGLASSLRTARTTWTRPMRPVSVGSWWSAVPVSDEGGIGLGAAPDAG